MYQLHITLAFSSVVQLFAIVRLFVSFASRRKEENSYNLKRINDWPLSSYLHAWKTDANQKISHPIDENRDGHGGRSRALREQFRRDHPGYRSGPHGEEHDETQGRHHRDVGHPVDHFLHIAKELLSGSRIVFFFPEQLEEPQEK